MLNYCHGSTQPTIPMSTIRELPIEIPFDIFHQRKAAHILMCLDKQINFNNAINKNLEKQAQAIFKAWFIDRIGPPYSSKTVSLATLMDYSGGSQPPASEFIYEDKEGYDRFIQIRDYDTDDHITYIPKSRKNKLCDEHDIMIARYGASLGRICFGINGAYNVALAKVFPVKEYYREFLRCYLSSHVFFEGINNKGGRSAQAGFNASDIKSFEIDFPTDNIILIQFEKSVAPLFEYRLHILKENRRLANLRDALLPRLMSGEIDVSEIEL